MGYKPVFYVLLLSAFALGDMRVPQRSRCRCLSSDPCWPSASDFAGLQSQVSQPLLRPLPPASPCYPVSHPSGDCAQVQKNAEDGFWRAAQPGSQQNPNFETYIAPNGTISACYVNTTIGAPCEQGSVPVLGVDARSASDVKAAIKFAKDHNLRIVVKSTGHDYLGRSTAKGAFLIWTHNFQDIHYDPLFIPQGGPPKTYQAMTIGSGVQWRDVYAQAEAHGRVVMGGGCPSVGAASGWILGGGHSMLSPTYGLGVDNVLQFSIVTPGGEELTVNAYNHPDLFWALRGGGPGTYGVLLSVTYLTHGPTPLVAQVFAANVPTLAARTRLVEELLRQAPSISDAGWGFYGSWDNTGSFAISGVAPGVSEKDANATWSPFIKFARGLEGANVTTVLVKPFDTWFAWYKALLPPFPIGVATELISRLLPRKNVQASYSKIAQTIAPMNGYFLLVAGGAVSKVNPNAMGVNPAWRTALVHFISILTWPEGTSSSEIRKIQDTQRQHLEALSDLDKNAGAYLNEASLYERHPQKTFFGSHYRRLKKIKHKYDPSELFIITEGVGAENWDQSLNCRRVWHKNPAPALRLQGEA